MTTSRDDEEEDDDDDDGEKGMSVQRLSPARKLFDGSAAVRTPEVFKEDTAPPPPPPLTVSLM